jgi:hypothetical protein
MVSSLCLSTISGQTLRVRPVGKPVSIFPDHALTVASCRRLRLRKTIREPTDLNSGKRVRSVAQALRRLSEGAKEATAHPLAIAVYVDVLPIARRTWPAVTNAPAPEGRIAHFQRRIVPDISSADFSKSAATQRHKTPR